MNASIMYIMYLGPVASVVQPVHFHLHPLHQCHQVSDGVSSGIDCTCVTFHRMNHYIEQCQR